MGKPAKEPEVIVTVRQLRVIHLGLHLQDRPMLVDMVRNITAPPSPETALGKKSIEIQPCPPESSSLIIALIVITSFLLKVHPGPPDLVKIFGTFDGYIVQDP
jgi:hypothetical protein